MARRSETTIPLLLWISAAAVVHWFSYQGTDAIAELGMGNLDLRAFAASVQNSLRPSSNLEVAFEEIKEEPKLDEPKPEEPKPLPPPPKAKQDKTDTKKPDEEKKEPPKPPPPPPPKKIHLDLPKMTPPPPVPPPPPPPPPDQRVAVQQNVDDKKQQDNPEAKFIADEANHVKEETQARQTNHDKNDKTTSPGANKAPPSPEIGNAEKTMVRDSDDHKGDDKRAPGEKAQDKANDAVKLAGKANQPPTTPAPNLPPSDKAGQNGVSGPKIAANNPPPAPVPVPAAAPPPPAPSPKAMPEPITSPDGTYAANPFRKPDPNPKPDSSATASRIPESRPDPKPFSIPKLGGGAGPNGINLNLTPGGALAAVGDDNMRKEREADGERRRSAHRGAWKPSGIDRIKQQIENYVASIKPGNTTALNTAAKPFASYLNRIHNRLHPIFAEDFLASLDSLPETHALNQQGLKTVLEVVLDKEKGKIVKMGVVKTSGVTTFDAGALDAMDRAGPFGKPPDAIVSHDDRVYLHWEFHRRPEIACSTTNAFPFMLAPGASGEPAAPPSLPGPRAPFDPREKGSPMPQGPSREGNLQTPATLLADKRRAG